MPRLFGTNGVRGVVNRELTPEMVLRLSASAGHLLGREIAVGRDGRTSSEMLAKAAIGGLLSVGCRVHDMGLLPTPTLQYAVKHLGLDGGLMITASHNPPEFNGVKVILKDGVEAPRGLEEEIEGLYFSGGPPLKPWGEVGSVGGFNPLDLYVEGLLRHVDVEAIRRRRFRVALDPGNGVSALTAPTLARRLGCEVYTINTDIDGAFPGRGSEPRPDNLGGLSRLMEAVDAEVGVAFDGDGDRALFVDEGGVVHWGDRSFALVVRDYLSSHPGEAVATPVSSSKMIEEVAREAGGCVLWTRVGSIVVSRTMLKEGISLGGEENGGIFYGPHQPVRDGGMALALILDLLAREGRPLSELMGELPRYVQRKERVPCPNELKPRVLEALRGCVEAERVETIDGVKLWFSDGSWILMRPSGTEPIFRIYAEAEAEGRLNRMVEEHRRLLEALVEEVKSS
ncbi:MAG: phosphomannomutase [Candidatus Bathyarchaeota archaeon B23]|nr:MAG: phosphomannomutase [Candidatus Bathyarchaeota archaeon B23]